MAWEKGDYPGLAVYDRLSGRWDVIGLDGHPVPDLSFPTRESAEVYLVGLRATAGDEGK